MTYSEHFWCVIPAGGVGSRLWPLSRADAPKFLLDVKGQGKSLLQSTWARLTSLAPTERMLVVTGAAHAEAVAAQLPELASENLITETEPRESSAAIGLAAALLLRRDPDAIIGSFAADHLIRQHYLFERAVNTAIKAAGTGAIVTIGIRPTHPATGFGYIKAGEPRADIAPIDLFEVKRFQEKPSRATARKYVASGEHLWNAGMFIARADVLLAQMAETEPELVAALQQIAEAWETPARDELVAKLWPEIKKIAIDYSVAEPAAAAGRMLCVAGHFKWDDIGDFASVAEQLTLKQASELAVLGDSELVIAKRSSGIVVPAAERVIAVTGVSDIVVVDTPDALLITNKANAQRVKQLRELVRQHDRGDLL